MKVVMIDSAINCGHKCFSKADIIQYHFVDGDWVVAQNIAGTGHGTAVANILCSNINKRIQLINFCVFDSKLSATADKFISALEYIFQNIDTSIVNLSLGTTHNDKRLYDICKKLTEKGIILVAGFDNNGAVSFPAAYDCVLGVDTSYKCIHKRDFVFVEDSMVNVRAMGGNQRVAWNNPEYTIISGTSFATAHVTNEIVNFCFGRSYNQVLSHFKELAKYVYEKENNENIFGKEMFEISTAALLPVSKEIHSLLNFSNLLPFSIAGIYDTKYSGRMGLSFETIDGTRKYEVENLDNCNWGKIDTFILGHIHEINQVVQEYILNVVVSKCIQYRVKLFCFDYQIYIKYKDLFNENCLEIKTPYMGIKKQNKFGKLYKISRPILAVFGTSSQQGKFTLQLQLRKLFLQNQYSVGQLGTEPTALLFGMDECFPFGYNSPMRVEKTNRLQYIETVNAILHVIDEKKPDIILTGCQSNLTPMCFNNLNDITIEQINFLMGVNPDAVVLCVNPYDHFNYIERSIKCIEGLSCAKVLAIALFPFSYENNWAMLNGKKCKLSHNKINEARNVLVEQIGLPVFEIGNEEDIKALFELCIDYF